jgi:alpha-beta hydrolase superfamily lysophospholipase
MKIRSSLLWVSTLFLSLNFAIAEDLPFKLNEGKRLLDDTQIAIFTTPERNHPSAGLFVYSHGTTSRTQYHTPLLKAVYEAGYDVIAYDLPGHGNSEKYLNFKGGVRDFNQYLNVLDGVIQEGEITFGKNKLYLSGWSLGGLISTVYLQNHSEAQAAILFAPGIGTALSEGDLSILTGIKARNLVHDESFAKQLEMDPFFFKFPPPCYLMALYRGISQAKPDLFKTTTLLFTAGEEYFASTKKILSFYQEAQKTNGIRLEMHHYPKSRHDLENDIDSESVIRTTVDFLKNN